MKDTPLTDIMFADPDGLPTIFDLENKVILKH
jgi:hypothetical protein